ncbi:IS1182 family transposase, partial [Caecibacteroides pullorum]
MAKIHFRPYTPNQTVLFPQRIDEDIAENDPIRMVDALVESLNLEGFRKLYKECGRSPYHPKMMLKVILYAYMNNIYSCRKIEKLLRRDIHYIWLAGYEKPDFITINRFRNRVKKEINEVFTQTVLLLSSKGFISLNVEYIDGTKIESKANKYTFVWRKSVERNRERLMKKISVLLSQIDDVIAQEKASENNEEIEFTPSMLTEMAGELRTALEQTSEPSTKEQKSALGKKRKQLKELEAHRDKLQEYNNHLDNLQDRNSYSKTDKEATFMRMKEDAMHNGQTKPGYNLQIATENQFIIDYSLFPNPTDTLTMIPFLKSFADRYGRLAHTVVADSGYGSEENYHFMSENGMEAYVKYNCFHMEQRPRFKPNPFKAENFFYNEEQDYCVCPMGQKMQRAGTRHTKTESGYVVEYARYRAVRCEGCPLRCLCFKAKGNRTIELNHRLRIYKQKARELLCSEEGLKHRGQRCIEPEAVFGQIKFNMNYKRFRHFGKDKVLMDFSFLAIAFNIKKMCTKMNKEGINWP